MMQKKSKTGSILTWICIGIMLLMLCAIGLRLATSKILTQRLGISNRFTDFVLSWDDLEAENEAEETESSTTSYVAIDWEELYPFDEDQLMPEQTEHTITDCYHGDFVSDQLMPEQPEHTTRLEKLKEIVQSVENNVETYDTDFLPGYKQIAETANRYEQLVGWNFVSYTEYNGIIELEDNYFVGLTGKNDVLECAESVISFAGFCRENGADFLYIASPGKISKYEDTDISGTLDFSNQNSDEFLAQLSAAGVSTFDLREPIRESGQPHHSFFYQTDHHWKAETGLWASKLILERLSDEFGMDTHPEVLNPENFDAVIYPDWFLGSQGKKATLARAVPEDITLLYPKAESKLHYVIPNLGIDEIGDFSVTYDMTCVDEIDYYEKNPYGAYNHADQPVIKIENELVESDESVLFIHNSFDNCVIPFLSLDIKNIESLDLRHFTGSVEKFVMEKKPDVVIVDYGCGSVGQAIDWTTHNSKFDFR